MEAIRENNTQNSYILATLGKTATSPCESLAQFADRAASNVANPYLRSGFKKAMKIAIKEAQEDFEGGSEIQDLFQRSFLSIVPRCRPIRRRSRMLTDERSRTSESFFGDITIQSSKF